MRPPGKGRVSRGTVPDTGQSTVGDFRANGTTDKRRNGAATRYDVTAAFPTQSRRAYTRRGNAPDHPLYGYQTLSNNFLPKG